LVYRVIRSDGNKRVRQWEGWEGGIERKEWGVGREAKKVAGEGGGRETE